MATDQRKWWVLFGVSLACFVAFVDFTIISTALPAIQLSLSASLLQLQWVMNVFVLAISMFMVTMGRLGDVLGQRVMLLGGIILFAIASLGAGCALNPATLIFFRALQGIATATLIPPAIAVIAVTFPKQEVGRAMGIWTAITGIGMAVGPVLGGMIVSWLNWRYIFFINLPVCLISFPICWRYLERCEITSAAVQQIDWLGFITMAIAIACLVVPVIQSSSWQWTSPITLSLLAISAVVFILFVIIERRSAHPLIAFEILAHRNFLAGSLANFCLVGFVWAAFFLLPLYLHDILHRSDFYIGLTLLCVSGALTLMSPVTGHIADRFGSKKPVLIGLCLLLLSTIGQSLFNASSSEWYVAVCLVVMGVAWALIVGPAVRAAVSAAPPQFSGLASGALWTLQNIGGSLGLAIGGVILHHSPAFISGMSSVMHFFVIVLLVAVLGVAILMQSEESHSPSELQPTAFH